MKHVALRYFNACGATPTRGEDHCPETHLIPLVLFTVLGRRPYIGIYGMDYPTPDGTCVRDYVHVSDLARAHMLALEYLEHGRASQKINLGNAKGFSVQQIIDAVEKVTGHFVPTKKEPRRPGDPSRTGAAIEKAKEILGWKPEYTDIHEIIRTAWEWHLGNPKGYVEYHA
jgi:UDP-glucose 4-epimerase